MIRSLFSLSRHEAISQAIRLNVVENSFILKQLSHTSSSFKEKKVTQDVMKSPEEQLSLTKEIIGKVNHQISTNTYGRLFAVVVLSGFQYLLKTEDLLAVKFEFDPTAGDKIRFEKVLCVGGNDFTLHGRPLLPKDLVYVEATVVEKTLGASEVKFRYRKKAINFRKPRITVLRINEIRFDHQVNSLPSVQGVQGRIF